MYSTKNLLRILFTVFAFIFWSVSFFKTDTFVLWVQSANAATCYSEQPTSPRTYRASYTCDPSMWPQNLRTTWTCQTHSGAPSQVNTFNDKVVGSCDVQGLVYWGVLQAELGFWTFNRCVEIFNTVSYDCTPPPATTPPPPPPTTPPPPATTTPPPPPPTCSSSQYLSGNVCINIPAPTLSVSRSLTNIIVGNNYSVSWSTTNATSVSYNCSGGFNGSAGVSTSGSQQYTAPAAWVGTTSCAWSANGPGGSVNSYESFTISPTPISYIISFADYQSGINPSATVGSPSGSFGSAGSRIFTAYDKRGNFVTCNPTATLSAGILYGGGSCVWYVSPTQACTAGYVWNGNSCIIDPNLGSTSTLTQGTGTCTNQSVIVSATCTGWGCPVQETVDLSPRTGVLLAPDVTGIIVPIPYTVNNIDKGMPILASYTIEDQIAPMTMLAKASVGIKVRVDDPKDPLIEVHCGKSITVVATLSSPGVAGISPPNTVSSTTTITEWVISDLSPLIASIRGVYTLTLVITDRAGNSLTRTYPSALTVYPNVYDPNTSSLTLVLGGGTWKGNGNMGGRFGNGLDTYRYEAILRDAFSNAINGKAVTRVAQTGPQKITANMTNTNSPTGPNVIFTNVVWTASAITDNTGKFNFDIASSNFGTFTEQFTFDLKAWSKTYIDIGSPITRTTNVSLAIRNSFKKPYTASLKVISKPNMLQVGAMQNTEITVASTGWGSPSNSVAPEYTMAIVNFSDVKASTPDHEITHITSSYAINTPFPAPTGTSINFPSYQSRIEAVSRTSADTAPAVTFEKATNPRISYILAYKNISGVTKNELMSYRLTPENDDDGILSISGTKFTGLSVNGNIQATGKQDQVNFNDWSLAIKENFTDVAASSVRSSIKKNAYKLIRGMDSDKVVDGVKYILGNYTLEATPNYETLVIVDGNLIIKQNVDIAKFGIIVMNDKDVSTGNIFITPDVWYIKALIYADGSIQSANAQGLPFTGDTLTRTNALQKQLVFFWSLITRNTIGGALLWNDRQYRLPSNIDEIASFDTAVKYDLNYLRRSASGALQIRYIEFENATKPTVIRYNPSALKDPPKWFYVR